MKGKHRRNDLDKVDVLAARVVMLCAGLLAIVLFAVLRVFPRLLDWLPDEVMWLLLLGPVCLILGICPAGVVRWAMRNSLRIILFVAGLFFAAVGAMCIAGGSSEGSYLFMVIGAAMILFAAALILASLLGTNKTVEKWASGL